MTSWVNGRVVGRVRGLKVRLTPTARVEGDIIHKTIAIESGSILKARYSARKTAGQWPRRAGRPRACHRSPGGQADAV